MIERVKRLFARRRDEAPPDLPEIAIRPIGVVRNGVRERPADGWDDVRSRIVLRPELAEALLGLDTFSHVQVLFWPHLIPREVLGSKPRLHPRDDPANPLQGVLATRSQIRFNPILCTAVRLLKVERNVLHVRGLDAIDGSPVLDVKPYVAHFDSIKDAKVPDWVTRGGDDHRRR